MSQDLLFNNISQCLFPVETDPIVLAGNIKPKGFKDAAVLIPLFLDENKQWQIIFTRRAEHLKNHPGQISFPGGAFEGPDQHLSKTALRETYEEIGINSNQIQLVGQLPQQKTLSNYLITPFIGKITTNHELNIDTNEVAEAFYVPLEFAIDPINQNQQIETNEQGINYSFNFITYRHYKIWGATANILVNLTQRLKLKISNF